MLKEIVLYGRIFISNNLKDNLYSPTSFKLSAILLGTLFILFNNPLFAYPNRPVETSLVRKSNIAYGIKADTFARRSGAYSDLIHTERFITLRPLNYPTENLIPCEYIDTDIDSLLAALNDSIRSSEKAEQNMMAGNKTLLLYSADINRQSPLKHRLQAELDNVADEHLLQGIRYGFLYGITSGISDKTSVIQIQGTVSRTISKKYWIRFMAGLNQLNGHSSSDSPVFFAINIKWITSNYRTFHSFIQAGPSLFWYRKNFNMGGNFGSGIQYSLNNRFEIIAGIDFQQERLFTSKLHVLWQIGLNIIGF
ncbi:MAG TPA: hypothetical protein ENK44_11575 [Caldithrix abyssi]|uniref:Uncharacterized protein n=1 Tax=Caldithrix abyssi TaxID=187145 RepID=A0A7V4U2B3_CALAY|nr:hypothetical protein [Caldithrix abyssi]